MKHVRNILAFGVAAIAMFWAIPASAQDAAKPPAMSHDAEGREQCLMCHGGTMEGMPAAPAESHEGRENPTCLLCHSPDSPMQAATPPAVPHDLAGRENCGMCHSGAMEGVPAPPESHEGYDQQYCGLCHKPAG